MLKSRTIEILRIICAQEAGVNLDGLADQYQVSKRMLRYDMDRINEFLKENRFESRLEIKKSNLLFPAEKEERQRLQMLVDQVYGSDYILSQEERVCLIVFSILQPASEEPVNYEYLCEALQVSRSTLVGDLKKVRAVLEHWDLELISTVKQGFFCKGREKAVRSCLVKMLWGEGIYTAGGLLVHQQNTQAIPKEYLIDEAEVAWLLEKMREIQQILGIVMSDNAVVDMIKVLLVSVRRMAYGSYVEKTHTIRHNIRGWREYSVCGQLAEDLQERYGLSVPEDEIVYLMTFLMGGSRTYLQEYADEENLQGDYIANKIISRFNRVGVRNLSFPKDILESFVNHVSSMVFRMEFDVPVTNPMVDEIRETYPQLFSELAQACQFLQEYFKTQLSDAELAYLVLYFQLVVEAQGETKPKPQIKRVAIVCSAGFVTGNLLAANLKKHFEFELLGVTTFHRMEQFLREQEVDLIISTSGMKQDYGKPFLSVSPMLSQQDLALLRDYLPLAKPAYDKKLMEDILTVVEERTEGAQTRKIEQILEEHFHMHIPPRKKGILGLLQPEHVMVGLETDSWREAIRTLSRPLVGEGRITPAYVDRMIESVEKLGPYIVVTDDIAIPHAASGEDVRQPAIAVATFQKPLQIFDRKGIKAFVIFAIREKEDYRNMVMEIMDLIEDENFNRWIYSGEAAEGLFQCISLLQAQA